MPEAIHPTKLQIMEAAISLFSRKGFNGTTTKEIAQEAGIAEGTIFRHYTNKLEILYGMTDSLMPLIGVETLKKAIEESSQMDAGQALEHIIRNRFELISAGRDVLRIILVEMQYDSHLREVYIERVYKPIVKMIREFFSERMRSGEFREANPNLLTSMMFSTILMAISNQYFLGDAAKTVEPGDLADIFLNGIGREESHEEN